MFPIRTFFIAILFLFGTIPVGLAAQQVMPAQVKADAHRDVNRDMRESLWFMSGLGGSSAGAFTGYASGVFLGCLVEEFNILPDGVSLADNCGIGGFLLFGVLAVPLCVHLYPHSPRPPSERLLGKPPEYVAAYTHAYRSKSISLRKKWVTAGSVISNLGILTLLLNW